MIQPRLWPAALTWDGFSAFVYRTTPDQVRKLPVQWRGWVVRNQHLGETAETVNGRIERGEVPGVYDPQGAFDAFQGQSPQ